MGSNIDWNSVPDSASGIDWNSVDSAPKSKYPTWGSALTQMPFSLPASYMKQRASILEALSHPIDTASNMFKGVSGAAQSMLPEDVIKSMQSFPLFNDNREAAKPLIDEVKRLSTEDGLKEVVAEDPFYALSLVSGGAGAGKNLARLAPKSIGTPVVNALNTVESLTNPIVEKYLFTPNSKVKAEKAKSKVYNANRDAIAKEAVDSGFQTHPSQYEGGMLHDMLSGLSKETLDDVNLNNVDVRNKLAKQEIGLSEFDDFSKANFKKLFDQQDEIIDKVRDERGIKLTDDFAESMRRMVDDHEAQSLDFPGGIRKNNVDDILSPYLENKYTKNTVVKKFMGIPTKTVTKVEDRKVTGKGLLAEVTDLRQSAKKDYKAGDNKDGAAKTMAARKLEDLMQDHLDRKYGANSPIALNYKNAVVQKAKIYSVKNSLDDSGNVDPVKLARSDVRGDTFSGNLKLIRDYSNYFPKINKKSSQITRSGASNFDLKNAIYSTARFAPLAGGVYMNNIPIATAGAVLATAPWAIDKMIKSKPYQKSLADQSYGLTPSRKLLPVIDSLIPYMMLEQQSYEE